MFQGCSSQTLPPKIILTAPFFLSHSLYLHPLHAHLIPLPLPLPPPPTPPQMQPLTPGPTSDLVITPTTISQAHLSPYQIDAFTDQMYFAQMCFFNLAPVCLAISLSSHNTVISLKKNNNKVQWNEKKSGIGIHVPHVDEFLLFRKIHC